MLYQAEPLPDVLRTAGTAILGSAAQSAPIEIRRNQIITEREHFLIELPRRRASFVSGHDFSRAVTPP